MHIGTTVTSPGATIEVSVLINGTAQPLYRRPGDGKVFVAGVPGRAYTLRVRNMGDRRIEVISTVDGRHTLKDEPGDTAACRGLVFDARSAGEFTGWRISDKETREFIFGSPAASVAAQATGSAANTGVIGFAVYRERDYPAAHRAQRGYGTPLGARTVAVASAAASADSGIPATTMSGSTLGTGIGERREDRVGSTSFTRAYGEPDILVIGYDTEEVLRGRGILGPPEPDPFPGAGTGYEKYEPAP